MGIATKFKATFEDGRVVEGKTLPIDYVIAERHLGSAKQIEGEMYASMNALKRQGVEFTALDDFLKALTDYETIRDEEPASGNGSAPAGGPPSPSLPITQGSTPTS